VTVVVMAKPPSSQSTCNVTRPDRPVEVPADNSQDQPQ
jgi:hypothetical protein